MLRHHVLRQAFRLASVSDSRWPIRILIRTGILIRTTDRRFGLGQVFTGFRVVVSFFRAPSFTAVVSFFRAPSIGAAFELLAGATTFSWRPEFVTAFKFLGFYASALLVVDLLNEYRQEEYLLENASETRRLVVAVVLLVLLTCFSGNQINAFIYFQF